MGRASIVLALCLMGCGDDPPPPTHTTSHSHSADPSGSPHPTVVTEVTDVAPATLVRSTGSLRVDSAPIADGAPLETGQRLVLEAGAEAVIEMTDGDRITLFGPVTARMGEEATSAIEIVRGAAHVRLPPGPAGPRPPLRLATPESTIELIGPGEVLVVADPSGVTWNVALAGISRVENGDADAHHHARVTEIVSGHAVLVGDEPSEVTESPNRLEEARAAAQVLFATTTPLEPARLADRVSHAATDLDTALGWLEAEARHGRDLTDEHRAAVASGNSDEAMRLQSSLVGHAQELHALRDTARLRWERVSALVLAQGVTAGQTDPLAARRDRAASLLGLE